MHYAANSAWCILYFMFLKTNLNIPTLFQSADGVCEAQYVCVTLSSCVCVCVI